MQNRAKKSSSMNQLMSNKHKPKLLLLQPLSKYFEPKLSSKYDLIKPFSSPLPLNSFLSIQANSIQTLLSSGPDCTPISSSLLNLLPNLRLIVAATAGVDHVVLEACRERGVKVTNAGEVYSPDAADNVVGLLIDLFRRISRGDSFVKEGLWPWKMDYTRL